MAALWARGGQPGAKLSWCTRWIGRVIVDLSSFSKTAFIKHRVRVRQIPSGTPLPHHTSRMNSLSMHNVYICQPTSISFESTVSMQNSLSICTAQLKNACLLYKEPRSVRIDAGNKLQSLSVSRPQDSVTARSGKQRKEDSLACGWLQNPRCCRASVLSVGGLEALATAEFWIYKHQVKKKFPA